MKNEIMPFEHPAFGKVRVIMDETTGEPLFVAKDVAHALDYPPATTASTTRLFQHIPDRWKGLYPMQTLGGKQSTLFLSQQGLYFFLGRSDKPKALPYQIWIADDVVPNIVNKGGYLTPSKVEEVLRDPDTIIKLATALKEEMAARQAAQAKLAEVQPKAQIVDAAFSNRSLQAMKVYELARKLTGVNASRIKRSLMILGYLYRKGQQYRVYSQHLGPDKLFIEKVDHVYNKHEIYATAKGAALLTRLYYDNELIMKEGHTI